MKHEMLPVRGMKNAACSVVCWMGLVFSCASAAELSIDEVLTAPRLAAFSKVALSVDGTAAYTVVDPRRVQGMVDTAEAQRNSLRTKLPWTARGGDVWLSDRDGAGPRNLTQGQGNSWGPVWSPDGRRLLFLTDRAGATTADEARLWAWDRGSGAFRQVMDVRVADMETALLDVEWLPDGRSIVIALEPVNLPAGAYEERLLGRAPVEKSAGESTVTVFSFDPAAPEALPNSGQVNVDMWLADLAILNTDTGAVHRIASEQRVVHKALSPDGRKLAWLSLHGYERAGSQQMTAAISVHDIASSTTTVLIESFRFANYPHEPAFSWSPRGDQIAYQTSGPAGATDEAYLVSVSDGQKRLIAPGLPVKEGNGGGGHVYWDDAGEYVYFARDAVVWRAAIDGSSAMALTRSNDVRLRPIEIRPGKLWTLDAHTAVMFTHSPATKKMGLARIDLRSGQITQIFEEHKRYHGYSEVVTVSADGNAGAFVVEDGSSHPQWRLAGVNGRPSFRVLSKVGPDLENVPLGNVKLIEWRSVDGDTLRGALLYPSDYRPGQRYPMIVKVYGGVDISNYLNEFGFGSAPVDNLHVLATRGYAVLMADSRLNVGTPMLDLLKSVMPGVDRAVELGVADPDRIGLMGHSYGGYSTLSLLVQTTRFKAAMASASIGDLITAHGSLRPDGTNYLMSWAETGQARMGGSPWEHRSRYIENSPLHYMDRVTTPLLIVNGSEDVNPRLADQTFSALRRLGKRVEYARYEGEGHWQGTWTIANQRDYLQRLIAWFDRYLKTSEL